MSEKKGVKLLGVKEMCIFAVIAAIMVATTVALSGIPNVHLNAVIIIVTTLVYGPKALYPVAVFVLTEGYLNGFGVWWIGYLYVWPLLVGITLLFKKTENAFFWAIIAGIYGLIFGMLVMVPVILLGDYGFTFLGAWISGIPYDITHAVSNFIITLVLFTPLLKLMKMLRANT